jgi:hypothetical protein
VSDAVLLVAEDRRTRRRDVEDLVARAAFTPGTTAAVVVAQLPRRRRLLPRRSAVSGLEPAPVIGTIEPILTEDSEQVVTGLDDEVGETA